MESELDAEWKKYSVKVKKLDLRYIPSGFVIFGSADRFRQTIYIDDIVFE